LLKQDGFLWRFGQLAIANIISNLMVPLASIIDTAFLGHLAEIRHLGGVALATVIFNVVYWTFGFLRMGTTGLTAQAQGRGDLPGLYLLLFRNGLIALILGLTIWLLQVPIRTVGFSLLNAEAEVRLAGEAFYNARIWGTPAVLLNFVLLGWFLGQGQGRRVMVLSLVGNGANIGLDYWFIRHFGWASAGAGAATALSQYLMLAVGGWYVVQSGAIAALPALRHQLWQPAVMGNMLRLNRDILIRTFVLVMSFALFTNWSAALGTTVLAANALLLQVITLAAYFIDGIAFATESFAGQFWGAGDRPQLRRLLTLGGSISLALGIVFALTFVLWPRSLFQLMTDHPPVLATVEQYVGWLLPILGFGAIAFMLDGYFLGLTAGQRLRISTVSAALLGFLPLALLAHWQGSAHGLWLALVGLMVVRALTLAWAVPQSLRAIANAPPETA
jgi:MATE family multidrug resistance protein